MYIFRHHCDIVTLYLPEYAEPPPFYYLHTKLSLPACPKESLLWSSTTFIYILYLSQSITNANHVCALHIMECTQTDKVAIANGEAPTLVGASSASNFV